MGLASSKLMGVNHLASSSSSTFLNVSWLSTGLETIDWTRWDQSFAFVSHLKTATCKLLGLIT